MVAVRDPPLPPKLTLPGGSSAPSDEATESCRFPAGDSTSSTVKATVTAVSSGVVWSVTSEMVGTSFTSWTVSWKRASATSWPSSTRITSSATPETLEAGVAVRVRLFPLPPRIRLASGSRLWFVEVTVTVKLAGSVSTSSTVKGRAVSALSSWMVWSPMADTVGTSFTETTVNRKDSMAKLGPSEARTTMAACPNWSWVGVMVRVRVIPLPLMAMSLLATREPSVELAETLRVSTSVSTSLTVKVTWMGVSSEVLWPGISSMTGASSTAFTVRVKGAVVTSSPSETSTVMTVEPQRSAAGVIVNVRVMSVPVTARLLGGTRAVSPDVVVMTRLARGVRSSLTVKSKATGTSSSVVWSATPLTPGGWLGARTVKVKGLSALRLPSLTLTVMMAVPVRPTVGVRVKLRSASAPSKWNSLRGVKVGLDEVAVRTRLAKGVSTSPTVKEMGPVVVPDMAVCSAMLEMVGPSFTGFTVSTNVSWAVSDPSLTMREMMLVPV